MRIEQLVIEASTRGVMATFAGLGIKEDAATGSETGASETEYMLLPSKGACTINIEGQSFTSSLRGLRFLLSNPTDKGEQNLFALERSDLPSTGIECGFSATGLDVGLCHATRSSSGAALSGTGPTVQAVQGDVTFNFQSAELMGAGNDAYPYRFAVTIPRCELRMGQFRAQGRDLVRFDLAGPDGRRRELVRQPHHRHPAQLVRQLLMHANRLGDRDPHPVASHHDKDTHPCRPL